MAVCAGCVQNDSLSKWIAETGRSGECDFCKSDDDTKIVTVEELAVKADALFRGKYQHGETYPEFDDSDRVWHNQYGRPYEEILGEELECDEPLLRVVIENLPDCSSRDISQGEEPFYDDGANYELIADALTRERRDIEEYWYENRFTYQWEDFCKIVKFNRRFINVQEHLDALFGDKAQYESGIVKPVYNIKRGQKIYRARRFGGGLTEKHLEEDPARSLSAPPPEMTTAGRMNVEFIPVFYAAFKKETAVSEIRPSKGDTVIVGEFFLTKEITVFDFTAFDAADSVEFSEKHEHTRYDFIKQMQEAISRPLGAFEKRMEYIPTQIAAEYIREIFHCDAIIYNSSITGGDAGDNRNIAIFRSDIDFLDGEAGVLEYAGCGKCWIAGVRYDVHDEDF
jgi:hypothetical protein